MRTFDPTLHPAARLSALAVIPMLVLTLAACSPPDSGNQPGTTATGGTDEGGGGDEGGAAETWMVHLADFEFDTEELTIAPGDTVHFVNDDEAPHTATHGENGEAADPAEFDIELSEAGTEGEVTLDEPGTYSVTCRFHPEMNMTITVEE